VFHLGRIFNTCLTDNTRPQLYWWRQASLDEWYCQLKNVRNKLLVDALHRQSFRTTTLSVVHNIYIMTAMQLRCDCDFDDAVNEMQLRRPCDDRAMCCGCGCDKTCQSPSDVIILSYFYLLTSTSHVIRVPWRMKSTSVNKNTPANNKLPLLRGVEQLRGKMNISIPGRIHVAAASQLRHSRSHITVVIVNNALAERSKRQQSGQTALDRGSRSDRPRYHFC